MPDGTIMTGKTHTSKSKKVGCGEPVMGINPRADNLYQLYKKRVGERVGNGIPTSRDEYIAQLYNQANLGANGRVIL
jgi:hypothetical protein